MWPDFISAAPPQLECHDGDVEAGRRHLADLGVALRCEGLLEDTLRDTAAHFLLRWVHLTMVRGRSDTKHHCKV